MSMELTQSLNRQDQVEQLDEIIILNMYMVQNRKNDFGIVKTVMFLCIMAILCSCKDIKKILTRNSYQYWHYIDSKQNEDETRHPYFCREDSFYFYVDSKGVFIEFRANWRFREYNGFLVSHYLYEPSWNLLNRNTIRFGRFRYKIISVSDNRILIRNDIDPKNAVDTLELVPKSHIPKDYRDFQKPFQYKEEKKDREKGEYFFIFQDSKKIICAQEKTIICSISMTMSREWCQHDCYSGKRL